MKRSLSPEQLRRIRARHQGYTLILITISAILLSQPLLVSWPWLSSAESIGLALVMLVYLVRFSPLRDRKRWIYSLGILAVIGELIWLVVILWAPHMSIHLAIPHLLIWALFIGMFLTRKMRALMLEPVVNSAVVMGAAAGYLLIGYLGGYLLHTLLLWQPQAFDPATLPGGMLNNDWSPRTFPAMVVASFGSLTTVGNPVGRPGLLLVPTAGLMITIAGQLYVAVLIALILGRFHRNPSS